MTLEAKRAVAEGAFQGTRGLNSRQRSEASWILVVLAGALFPVGRRETKGFLLNYRKILLVISLIVTLK